MFVRLFVLDVYEIYVILYGVYCEWRCFYKASCKRENTNLCIPSKSCLNPTGQSVILKPQNPSTGEFYVLQKLASTDFKALKFGIVPSGKRTQNCVLKNKTPVEKDR